MNEEDTIIKALREVGLRYIADSQQRLLGFLLTPEEKVALCRKMLFGL